MLEEPLIFFIGFLNVSAGIALTMYAGLSRHHADKIIKSDEFADAIMGNDSEKRESVAKRLEQWRVWDFFNSKLGGFIGNTVFLGGILLNLTFNKWWSIFILLIIAYAFFYMMSRVLKQYVQLMSIVSIFLSWFLLAINVLF